MNRIASLLLVLFAFLPGCAASVQSPDAPSAEVASLKAEVALLRQALAAQQGNAPSSQTTVTVPVAAPTVEPYYAVIGRRPPGCQNATSLLVKNDSGFARELRIDDVPVSFHNGLGQPSNLMPPHTVAWVCLWELGDHVITGLRYIVRGREPILDRTYQLHELVRYSGNHIPVFIMD